MQFKYLFFLLNNVNLDKELELNSCFFNVQEIFLIFIYFCRYSINIFIKDLVVYLDGKYLYIIYRRVFIVDNIVVIDTFC